MPARAGEALDKLVEIDPYDFGNQKRLTQLEASGDAALVDRIRSRLAQVATHSPQQPAARGNWRCASGRASGAAGA